jgi:hypothetical protein
MGIPPMWSENCHAWRMFHPRAPLGAAGLRDLVYVAREPEMQARVEQGTGDTVLAEK